MLVYDSNHQERLSKVGDFINRDRRYSFVRGKTWKEDIYQNYKFCTCYQSISRWFIYKIVKNILKMFVIYVSLY